MVIRPPIAFWREAFKKIVFRGARTAQTQVASQALLMRTEPLHPQGQPSRRQALDEGSEDRVRATGRMMEVEDHFVDSAEPLFQPLDRVRVERFLDSNQNPPYLGWGTVAHEFLTIPGVLEATSVT
jgi:hypothetical protein